VPQRTNGTDRKHLQTTIRINYQNR
jgi:hypothetical protein